MAVKPFWSLVCVALLFGVVNCQDACERIPTDVLGNSNTLEAAGLVARTLNPGGDAVDPQVRILDMTIVCEAQHMMEDRYRYTSVVVSFNCETTDARIPECIDSSVVNTEQFDFGCSSGTWTTNIITVSDSARTTNPIATLTTELDSGCILCINPNSSAVGSRTVSNVTHCEACSNCSMGLQRCYNDAGFNQVCCNSFYQGVCVTECPSPLAANPLNKFACEMECDMLSDEFGTFEFTNGQFNGSVATLTCNERYEVNNSPATCGSTGWSSTPICSRSECSELSVTNGNFNFTSGQFVGSIATLTCNTGFEASGTNPVTCEASGEWSGLPTCERLECPELSDDNGTFAFTIGQSIGSVATLSCKPGFDANGTNPVTCQASGEWSGLPTCERSPDTTTLESPCPGCIAGIVVGVFVGIAIVVTAIVIVIIFTKYKRSSSSKLI